MNEEPAYLQVGTDVSAKYRGAFCEAKVKKVVRNVKCKVTIKETGTSLIVLHDDINGHLKTGLSVEVKHPDTGIFVPCVINKITDQSTYTVVFDDGDENTLRRSQLCLKGEKHFVKTDTLDELPLTHPEHFGTPVMRGSRSMKSKRYMHNASSDSDSDLDSSEDEMIRGRTRGGRREKQNWIGRVVCVEIEDRKKAMWVPCLVVQPSADSTDLKSSEHILVKSFRDSKFNSVLRRDVREFYRDTAMKNEDKILKAAFEKALQYYDTRELPQLWDKDELLGSDSEDEDDISMKTPQKLSKNKPHSSKACNATPKKSTDSEEPSEERDRFVAQLYKFMDDRGTPMNKSPQIASRDLNLYKMFRLVQDMGGYNKVTNQMKWHVIYSKMGLPPVASASNQIKMAYKKYLHAFEDFDRKLGCTMGTITRPRARHSSGRNLLSFRERDRESTPKSPRSLKKMKEDGDNEDIPSNKENSDRSDVDSIKSDQRFRNHPFAGGHSSDSETDSVGSSQPARGPITREDTGRPVREEARKARDEAAAMRIFREEERRAKEERDPPERDDKEEGRQPKKRGRKKDEEEPKEEKRQPSKRRTKDDAASEISEGKNELSEEEEDEKEKSSKSQYQSGTKLKIKYGRGKNIKIYEAKVMEIKGDGGNAQYKVHYAGWNNRYDEWLKKDRIVGPVEPPPGSKGKIKLSKPSTPPVKPPKGPSETPQPPKKGSRKVPSLSVPSSPGSSASTTTVESVDPEAASKQSKTSSVSQTPSSKTSSTIACTKTPAVTTTTSKTSTATPTTNTKNSSATSSSTGVKAAPATPVVTLPKTSVPSAGQKAPAPTTSTAKPASTPPTTVTCRTPPPAPNNKPAAAKTPRPTRSTSMECSLAGGLQPKRRPRKGSGVGDTGSRDSDSELSDDESSDDEQIPERVTRSRAEADQKNKDTPDVVMDTDSKPAVPVIPAASPQKLPVTDIKPEAKETEPKVEPVASPKKSRVPIKDNSKTEIPEKPPTTATVEQQISPVKSEVKAEPKVSEKKVDDKIYDFEDSSSQDSFHANIPLSRHIGVEPKEPVEKGRFRRKDPVKRVRRHSTDSTASNDSIVKAANSKAEAKTSDTEPTKTTKDTLRSGKKAADSKSEPPKQPEPEKEKKKPGPKPKDAPSKSEQSSEKAKVKVTPKTEKARGKRKVDTTADDSSKTDEPVEVKKARRKKEPKEDKTKESPTKEPTPKSTDSPMVQVEASVSPAVTPEKRSEVAPPVVSWSPGYIPAPTLTQTMSIDTKSEREVIDEPAPQLSPIRSPSPCIAPPISEPAPELEQTAPQVTSSAPPSKEPEEEEPVAKPVFDNTPPQTPEGSPKASVPVDIEMSPTKQEEAMTAPAEEPEAASTEPQSFPQPCTSSATTSVGGDSPNTCNTSTVSNGSGGSSGNAPGSESEETIAANKRPKEEEVEEVKPAPKRRRRRQQTPKSTEKSSRKQAHKQSMSDSDDQDAGMKSPEPSSTLARHSCGHLHPPQRVSKYNFLDLEDGKYLEGEERIKFLMGKIQGIRKLYMQLKSEVACIDRRRKRHRRKMHEAAQAAAAAAAVAAVVSRGESEKS